MTVYFVYRSHYSGPSEKAIKKFDDASVLHWFQSRWAEMGEKGYDCSDLIGINVYGFGSLGDAIANNSIAAPANAAALQNLLDEHLYFEGGIEFDEHCIQVLTDDDELELAYYFFDDHYLEAHGEQAAFLLHDGWQLPAEKIAEGFVPAVEGKAIAPRGGKEGRVWITLLAYYDSENLGELAGPYTIEGIRLPDFPAWLARSEPTEGWDYPFELRLLRSQLFLQAGSSQEQELLSALLANPEDHETWSVYNDWLLEQGKPPAPQTVLQNALTACTPIPVGDITNGVSWSSRLLGSVQEAHQDLSVLMEKMKPMEEAKRSLIAVHEHLAQLCLHTAEWSAPMFHQWILFDDLWASAHPDLANGILRFSARWDVLS